MKTVIVFYSLFGTTKTVSEKIAIDLWFDLVEIKAEDTINEYNIGSILAMIIKGRLNFLPKIAPISVELSEYDCIIFGIPCFSGQCAAPMRSFLKRLQLLNKKVGYFIIGNGTPHNAHKEINSYLKNNKIFLAETVHDVEKNIDYSINKLKGQICKSMLELYR